MAKKENRLTNELIQKYENHVVEQNIYLIWKKKNRDSKTLVVYCDLQNVVVLPRANVSCFFYKRKLNVYNLTTHASNGNEKHDFCAVCHEGLCGQAGNDIASAVIKIRREFYVHYSNACFKIETPLFLLPLHRF